MKPAATMIREMEKLAERSLSALDFSALTDEIHAIARDLPQHPDNLPERLAAYLRDQSRWCGKLVENYRRMEQDLADISGRKDRIDRMIQFLETFTPREKIAGDRKAFKRWMDAIGVRERARAALHGRSRRMELAIAMLREAVRDTLNGSTDPATWIDTLHRLDIPAILAGELKDSPRWQNRKAVFDAWHSWIASLPESARNTLGKTFGEGLFRPGSERRDDSIWVRLAALSVKALIAPGDALNALNLLITGPMTDRNAIFLAAGAVEVVRTHYDAKIFRNTVQTLFQSSGGSDHVRITALRQLETLADPSSLALISRLAADGSLPEKVRATALLGTGRMYTATRENDEDSSGLPATMDLLRDALETDPRPLCQRAVLESMRRIMIPYCTRQTDPDPDTLEFAVLQSLDRTITNDGIDPLIRREAVALRESMLVQRVPGNRNLLAFIRDNIRRIPGNGRFTIPGDMVPDAMTLGRVMALACAQDFDLTARKIRGGYRVVRGDVHAWRFWRILHEILHPDPAKRQGFIHTRGRVITGHICARSTLLAEMSETKVPGERLFIPGEESWRPYMPLVDDFLAATSGKFRKTPLRIFSADGVFELRAPASRIARRHLWWMITTGYRRLVQLRNLQPGDAGDFATRGIIRFFYEDTEMEMRFQPHAYTCRNRSFTALDPVMKRNLQPVAAQRREIDP